MKKKILRIALISVAAVAIITVSTILIVNGVKKNRGGQTPVDNPITPAPITETLAKPENLTVNAEGILFWDAVEHATSYVVYIGDKEYVTDTNNYSLAGVEGKVKISVRAKGEGYIDSVKSAEIVYVATVDEADVQQSNVALQAFMTQNGINATEAEINELGTKLYKAGLESKDVSALCVSFQSIVDSAVAMGEIENKPNSSMAIVSAVASIAELDVAEYSLVEGSRLFGAFFLSKKADSLQEVAIAPRHKKVSIDPSEFDATYYSKGELIVALGRAGQYLDRLSPRSVQNISYVLAYFRTYKAQMLSLLEAFQKEGASLVSDSLYNDLAALKTTIVSALVNTMPSKANFDDVLATLEGLFTALVPVSLDGLLSFEGAKDLLINFYSANHYLVSFLDSLTDADVKDLLGNVQALIKSLNDGVVAELMTTIATVTAPDFSEEKVLQDVEEIVMAKAGQWFETHPVYGEIVAIPVPQGFDDIQAYVVAILEVLGVGDYIELSDENIAKIFGYFMNLIPDKIMSMTVSPDDIANFLYACHFEDLLAFDKEAFYEQLDAIDLVALVKGEITIEEVLATFDWESYFYLDYETVLASVDLAMADEMPALEHFIVLLMEQDLEMLLPEFGIEGLDVETVEALGAHLLEALGFEDGKNPFESLVNSVVEGLLDYVQEDYPILLRVPQVVDFVNEMKRLSEDPAAVAVGTLMPQTQALDFNYVAVYKVYNLVTSRYAKFLSSYQAPYAEGLTINYESILETACDGLGYFFCGTDIYYYKTLISDVEAMLAKVDGVVDAANELLEAVEGYVKEVQEVVSLDALLAGNLDLVVLAKVAEITEGFQEKYNALSALLGPADLLEIVDLVFDFFEVKGMSAQAIAENKGEIVNFINMVASYGELLDSIVATLPERYDALEDFLNKRNVLLASAFELLTEEVLPVYLDEEVAYDARVFTLLTYLRSADFEALLEGLYDRELLEAMLADLDIVYQGTPYGGQFATDGAEKLDMIDAEIAKWLNETGNVTTDYINRIDSSMNYILPVLEFQMVIAEARDLAIELDAIVNNPDAELSDFNDKLAELQALVGGYLDGMSFSLLLVEIDTLLDTELEYFADSTVEPWATLLGYSMDADTWAAVRTAIGIRELIIISMTDEGMNIDIEALKEQKIYDILLLGDAFTDLLNNDFVAAAVVASGVPSEAVDALKMVDMSMIIGMVDMVGLRSLFEEYTLGQLLNGEMLINLFIDFMTANFTLDAEHTQYSDEEMFFLGLFGMLPTLIIDPSAEDWALQVASLPEVWQQFFFEDISDPASQAALIAILKEMQEKEMDEILEEYLIAPFKEEVNDYVLHFLLPMLEYYLDIEIVLPLSNFLTDQEKAYLADWDYEGLKECFYVRLDEVVLSELFEEYIYEDVSEAYHSFPYRKIYKIMANMLMSALSDAISGGVPSPLTPPIAIIEQPQ